MSRLLATALATAAPWTAPAPIPGSVSEFPRLVTAADGSALVAWSQSVYPEPRPRFVVSARPPGGAFGPVKRLGAMELPELASYGRDRVLALGTTTSRHLRAVVRMGRTNGEFGPPRRLVPRGESVAVAIAANAVGDAAALVRGCATPRCSLVVPYLVIRRAGGSFGRPIQLDSKANMHAGAVALNARGDALVVWERPLHGTHRVRGIYARMRTATGRLGSTRRLGTAVPPPNISAALGGGGRAVVAWLGQAIDEGFGAPLTPATIQAAVAAPGRPFGQVQRLEVVTAIATGRYLGQPGVRTTIGVDRRPLIAWNGYESGHFVVRASSVIGTTIASPQVVSDPGQDTELSDLATGPRGQALVLGIQGPLYGDPGTFSVVAATRPTGAPVFGPAEAVSEPSDFAEAARAAFAPDGGVLVTWGILTPSAIVWATRDPVP